MKIKKVLFSCGHAAFYFDDQQAIKKGAEQDGFFYTGKSLTPGFTRVRQAGEAICIQLLLDNGQIATGDCAAVQYSGAGGRDPLLIGKDFLLLLEKVVSPLLEGREASSFTENARFIEEIQVNGKPLHTAIRYGISQALLDACAIDNRCSKMEVVCWEYSLPVIPKPVPLFGQSGDDRYTAVDKMILREVDALPHGLINHIDTKLGRNGEKLSDYVRWLSQRIQQHRSCASYHPKLHIDVYGTIGMIYNSNPDKIAAYIAHLQDLADPFDLYIEGPVDMGNREQQIETLQQISNRLQALGSNARIVADEWCNTYEDIVAFTDANCCDMVQIKTPDLGSIHNTIEAVLYCKTKGMETYQGGTCNETDLSAKACVHVAMATRPDRMLAKPGMGFDEGMSIVANEMQRLTTLLNHRYALNPVRPTLSEAV